MIIPIRCFTCGKVIGNKWETYLNLLQAEYTEGCVSMPEGEHRVHDKQSGFVSSARSWCACSGSPGVPVVALLGQEPVWVGRVHLYLSCASCPAPSPMCVGWGWVWSHCILSHMR